MTRLGVNIDHVATLRQVRGTAYPDPLQAALMVEEAGAYSVVTHLREDRRHIQEEDVFAIKRKLRCCKLNLEMAIAGEIVDIASDIVPYQATLVPERRRELTTEGGLQLLEHTRKIEKVIRRLKGRGIKVSLFIEPAFRQITRAFQMGADMIELHTGEYSRLKKREEIRHALAIIKKSAGFARAIGFKEVAAGHGLHYDNIIPIVSMEEIDEFNIGHSIIAESVFVGLESAVKKMQRLINAKNN